MERRTALATAGAITATVMTAAIALGANMGLFGLASAEEGPGNLRLVDTPEAQLSHTEVIDVPVPVTVGAPSGSDQGVRTSSGSGAPAPYVAPSSGYSDDDDSYDEPDDEHEYEDDSEDELEDD